tara:strand:+ start:1595 stop:2389 length:795 start_codon:yes stop_codon:yes gene_type:complete
MIENINEIEKSLGLEEGKLTELISSEENHSVDLSERVFFAKGDYDLRTDNLKKDHEKIGGELLLKGMKEEQGLDYEGRKDPSNFITALKTKIEAESKIEPEQRYSELKSNFDKLQVLKLESDDKFISLQESGVKEKNRSMVNNALAKEIPENTIIDSDKIVTLLKIDHEFKITEDGLEIVKNGKVLKNESTLSNLTASEFMKDAVKPYLKAVDGGAGDRDDLNNFKSGSQESFDKEMEGKGVKVGSEAYNKEMFKRISDKSLTI